MKSIFLARYQYLTRISPHAERKDLFLSVPLGCVSGVMSGSRKAVDIIKRILDRFQRKNIRKLV